MKYIKDSDILSKYLLEEILQYLVGCIVYIPNKIGNRRACVDTNVTKIKHGLCRIVV